MLLGQRRTRYEKYQAYTPRQLVKKCLWQGVIKALILATGIGGMTDASLFSSGNGREYIVLFHRSHMEQNILLVTLAISAFASHRSRVETSEKAHEIF